MTTRACLLFLVMFVFYGCSYYSGVSRFHDSVYLTGATSFMGFGSSWVKKCTEREDSRYGKRLDCLKLSVRDIPFSRSTSDVTWAVRQDDELRSCIDKPAPNTDPITFQVLFNVLASGAVSEAQVSTGLDEGSVEEACAIRRLKELLFPPSGTASESYTVTITISPPPPPEEDDTRDPPDNSGAEGI